MSEAIENPNEPDDGRLIQLLEAEATELRAFRDWVRRKLGAPAGESDSSLYGRMHVVCSHHETHVRYCCEGRTEWHRRVGKLEIELGRWQPAVNQILDGPVPDPIETIARRNGWLPLTVGETMSAGFWPHRYQITRLEDDAGANRKGEVMEDERSFGPNYGKPEPEPSMARYHPKQGKLRLHPAGPWVKHEDVAAITADLLAACKAARESFERLNMKGTPLDRQLQAAIEKAAIEKAEPTT